MNAAIDYRLKIEKALEHSFEYLALINPAMASLVRTIPHYTSTSTIAAAFASSRACYYTSEFATFPVRQRAGVIVHEWCHVALAHSDRKLMIFKLYGALSQKLFNIAADLMINTWIEEVAAKIKNSIDLPNFVVNINNLTNKIPEFREIAPTTKLASRHNITSISQLASYDVETIYIVLLEVMTAIGKLDEWLESCEGGDSLDNDIDTQIDEDPAEDGKIKNPSASNGVSDSSRAVAHVIGALAGSDTWNFASRVMAQLPSAKVDWRRRVREISTSLLSDERATTWTRPSRRLYAMPTYVAFMPGQKSELSANVVCIIDTSCSVTDKIIEQFMAEICRVATITHHEVTVMEADTEVKKISVIKPNSPKFMPRMDTGRGGTDFNDALRAAAALRPDAIIYLTDLVASHPTFRPKCAVIWCAVGTAPPMPFGRHVRIPMDAE